jgi:hypothetical protein
MVARAADPNFLLPLFLIIYTVLTFRMQLRIYPMMIKKHTSRRVPKGLIQLW